MEAAGEEVIEEIDRDGKVIATHPVSYLKERMFLHRASLIIPKTGKNGILLSRRAKDQHPYPDTWVCGAGGKARPRESDEQAAIREMKEEIGRTYPLKKVATFIYEGREYKAVFSVFTTTVEVSPDDFKLDPKEIQYSKGFRLGEVLKMIKERPEQFAPTFIAAIREFAKKYR